MEDREGDEEQLKEGPRVKCDGDDERAGVGGNKMPALTNLSR